MTDTSHVVALGDLTTLSVAGTSVAQVLSIDFSGFKADKVKKTCLGDVVQQNRNGLAVDGGELTFTVQIKAGEQATYTTLISSGAESAAVLSFYSAASSKVETWTWAKAVVQSFKVSNIKENENVEAECVVYFNDLPTIS